MQRRMPCRGYFAETWTLDASVLGRQYVRLAVEDNGRLALLADKGYHQRYSEPSRKSACRQNADIDDAQRHGLSSRLIWLVSASYSEVSSGKRRRTWERNAATR